VWPCQPVEAVSSFWQAVFVFVVNDPDAESRLMEEQAALKSMNAEQTASVKTALLHRARDFLAVRTPMQSASLAERMAPL
jgi:hypothetical protein